MRYEVKIGVPGNTFIRNVVVEAPDELTAALRTGLQVAGNHSQIEVLAIRSEQEAYAPVLDPE
jgi:hypothetical protein